MTTPISSGLVPAAASAATSSWPGPRTIFRRRISQIRSTERKLVSTKSFCGPSIKATVTGIWIAFPMSVRYVIAPLSCVCVPVSNMVMVQAAMETPKT